ncbi:MAG: S1 RNA-binding domain-containing protein, partial [Acidobacteriota bacterium]
MSITNSNQPAVGVSEAQEAVQNVESAQPATVAAPFQVAEAAEAAATATAPEVVPASANTEVEAAASATAPTAEASTTEAALADVEADAGESADGGDGDEMNFADILAAHEKSHSSEINENEVVKGRVVKITDQVVVIDVGYKSEGIVPLAEFKDGDKILVAPGDEVDVFVKQLENNEGYVELSRADALRLQTWDQIEKAGKDGTNVIGRVTDRIKGGLRVDIGGIQAFLPGSQVDVRPVRNLDSFRNKEIEVRVIKVNKKRGNIVLSRKAVLEEVISGKKNETLRNLEEGIIIEGQVKNITEYGAFIDLGGIDGLLHITDMSWGRIQNPSEIFKVGENIQVKILKFDRDKERVSL